MAVNFETMVLVPAAAGLNVHRTPDEVPANMVTEFTSCIRPREGAITGRAGLAPILTTTTLGNTHTIMRLNDRFNNTFLRVVGISNELWGGTTGAATLIEAGLSASPWSTVEFHPPLSSDTWGFMANGDFMRKIRASDGLSLQVGLPKATALDNRFWIDQFKVFFNTETSFGGPDLCQMICDGFTQTTGGPGSPGMFTDYGTLFFTEIDDCETAGWVNRQGTGGVGSNTTDTTNFKQGTASLKFTTNKGTATATYYNFWCKPRSLDLSTLSHAKAATDDDIVHMWVRTDKPDKVSEIRIYFVCTKTFDDITVPGQSDTLNTDAYVKAFRASDFTALFQVTNTAAGIANTANTTLSQLNQLPPAKDKRPSTLLLRQQQERSRKASSELSPGAGSWTEYGVVGVPLHRNEFQRIGSDSTRGWGTITGMVVLVDIIDNTTAINVWFDDIFLRGGAGLDSSLIGDTPYDYRYTHYDPRTGAESNPSDVQPEMFRLDSLRQEIKVSVPAFGDAAIRQRLYRRGGTLNNAWYFVSENTADGQDIIDDASDLDLSASRLLEFDNDQPVTTVKPNGDTVLAQPLSAIWGPVNDIIFGCGDPYRPGYLYWCKPTAGDHWPANNNVEACSASEQLMCGVVYAGAAFAFSRQRMYAIIPNLANSGIVTVLPTQCSHGVVNRFAAVSSAQGIFFIANDGIYVTTGGAEQNITDEKLRPLFQGQTATYQPVDYATGADSFRLEMHNNELYFLYSTPTHPGGSPDNCLVYNLVFDYWRYEAYPEQINTIYSERGVQKPSLLLGGGGDGPGGVPFATGMTFQNAGTFDMVPGTPVSATAFQTGAIDFGFPRDNKLYGDVIVDVDRKDAGTINVTALLNTDNDTPVVLSPITTGSGRQRYYLTGLEDVQSRNIALLFDWLTDGEQPIFYKVGISWALQGDTSTKRYTNWDAQGVMADKYVKGISLQVDTGGLNKVINVEADGVVQATITVNTPTRRVQQFSFPQFRGRLLRLVPQDTVEWKVYQWRWIFDDEPLGLTRWETQFLNHGVPMWQTPLWAHVSLASTADVNLTLTAMRQDGTSNVQTYVIGSTGGAKVPRYVPFAPQKGVLFKYLFESNEPFFLYKEESVVIIQPWGATQSTAVQPFGTDDLDKVRQTQEPGLAGVIDRYSGQQMAFSQGIGQY